MFLQKPHALAWGEQRNQPWALALIEDAI